MMLAPPSEYTYSPSSGYQQTTQLLHHQSDERPKIYGLDPAQNPGQSLQGGPMSGGMPMMSMHEYHQQMMHPQNGTPQNANMTPQNAMTPQHAVMTPSQYDHEPLVMNVAPTGHYYAPMGTHMLLVSSDFDYANANAMNGNGSIASSTSSSKGGNKPGTKRSREDLNLKEKKRMFKLNDRITQLKQILEDAGVQTKKNKQSVLDNAAYFIEQLQSDLMIAKQKAERAEREAEKLKLKTKQQAQQTTQSKPDVDAAAAMLHECFRQSSTPRVITDASLVPVQANAAFLAYAGVNDDAALRSKDRVVPLLCADAAKLEAIVAQVLKENRVVHTEVQTESAEGPSAVLLIATAIKDGKANAPSHIEFSVLPMAAPSPSSSSSTEPSALASASASASASSAAESNREDAASGSDATDASSGSEPEEESSA